MKLLAGILVLFSMSFANAAEVKSAELSYDGKYLIVGAVHGGGCGTHEFSLNKLSCLETYPVRCAAELVHKTDDMCEALISSTIVFDLEKEGYLDSYFSQGSLNIIGTDGKTSAGVTLPKLD